METRQNNNGMVLEENGYRRENVLLKGFSVDLSKMPERTAVSTLARDEGPAPEKKFIRIKEATERYGFGRTKLAEIARESGAVIKIDGTMLIEIEVFERFLESFRLRGGSFY